MYEVGEYIVHPGQGVCKVDGVVEQPQESYVLLPVGARHATRISFPVASEARLRPVVSADEAKELIDDYAELPIEDFSSRSNALEEEHFKDEIRHGSCRDTVRVAKTFRQRIAEVRERGKKPPVAYERILKQASDRSLQELAVALDLSVDDVRTLFSKVAGDPSEN